MKIARIKCFWVILSFFVSGMKLYWGMIYMPTPVGLSSFEKRKKSRSTFHTDENTATKEETRRAWIHCQTTDKKSGDLTAFAFSAHSPTTS